ncbi:MAG: tetratricopeptide repeat protein [Pyrinomonadaceae bacterium]
MSLRESLSHIAPTRRRTGVALCALLFVALCTSAARAQVGVDDTGTGGKHVIQGRIVFPSGRRADTRLKVRLQTQSAGELSVYTDSNGYFGFRSLEAGSYTVVIEGGNDFETVRESVYIETDINSMLRGVTLPSGTRPYTLQVYLQPKRKDGTPAAESRPGTLNASLASVPKPALDLYNKALDALRGNDQVKAVEFLKEAVAAYHDFPVALTELGLLYMKQKQPAKAVEVLRDALKLSPDDYPTLFTYAVALHDSQQFSEAETQFRKAAQKNATAPLPHYYLGLILIRRREFEEAEKELKKAVEVGGDEVPYAHKYLGGLYWNRHAYKQAADELEAYLKLVPNTEEAPRLRATIKELRSKR